MRPEYTICIIWNTARTYETEICNYIRDKKIEIVKKYYVTWPEQRFGINLSAFYGDQFWDEPYQITARGNGEFILLVCKDNNPVYNSRRTGRGVKNVNIHMFDLKQDIRRNVIKSMAFHAADNEWETRRGLALILGKSLEDLLASGAFSNDENVITQDVQGVLGWNNLEHLFYIMNEACKYVVLRGFDNIPQTHRMDIHGDIDLLVEDLQQALVLLNPSSEVKNNVFKFMNYTDLKDQNILIHFKFLGDNYYDYRFEQRILDSRRLNANQIYVPSDEMFFWSLLYHGIFHKQNYKKYESKLKQIAERLQIDYRDDINHLGCLLADWLSVNGYRIKKHLDPDCASLLEQNIPYKKLINCKRKLYLYQGYYEGYVYLSLIFDEEMIRLNPGFLSKMVKPFDMFIDLERHVLRQDTVAYQILSERTMYGEYLWRYTLRYGHIAEFKYINNESGEYIEKGFVNGEYQIQGFDIEYVAEGKKDVVNLKETFEEVLKKLYCQSEEAASDLYEDFVCWVLEKYELSDGLVQGLAWDLLPKNCFYADKTWDFFDRDASFASPIEKTYILACQADYASNLFCWNKEKRNQFYERLCSRFNVIPIITAFENVLTIQKKIVDKVSSLDMLIDNGTENQYAIYLAISAYTSDEDIAERVISTADANADCLTLSSVSSDVSSSVETIKESWLRKLLKVVAPKKKCKTVEQDTLLNIINTNIGYIGAGVSALNQKNDEGTQVKLDALLAQISNLSYIGAGVSDLNSKNDNSTQVKLDSLLDKVTNVQQLTTQLLKGENAILSELNTQNFFKSEIGLSCFEKVGRNFGKANIHIYIVTYKKNEVLNRNLRSLYANASDIDAFDVTVLANHPNVIIEDANMHDNLRVVLNNTRALNSWGNLSKDWNWCLLDAFGKWDNPRNTEYCILAQNDVEWVPKWQDNLKNIKDYDFVSQPFGDQLLVFTIVGVRKIGFFDERFSTLHYHEEDYFLRAALHLNQKASINGVPERESEHYMATSFNYLGEDLFIEPTSSGISLFDDNYHTAKTHSMFEQFFMKKWEISKPLDEIKTRYELLKMVEDRGYPKEINWYPFFWEGYKEIEDSFEYVDNH